ncbi:MAG: hypothetical protein HGA47_01560 [Zoogloea sp.]|nr:hypothetical protein [Zoogloea sp.]
MSRASIQDKKPEELRKVADQLRAVKDSPIAKLSAKALELAEAGMWEEAIARWRALTDLEPDAEGHWFNLGYTLQKLAQSGNTDKISCHRQACEAYAEAVALKPDMHEAWNNWGGALFYWARVLTGAEQSAKFMDACVKYAEAVRIHPDKHMVWDNWGSTLINWAHVVPEPERSKKLTEARDVLLKAEALKAGPGAYDLGCVAALSGQAEEAREWLMKARAAGVEAASNCEHLKSDPDLDSLRDLPWFKAWLAEVCPGGESAGSETVDKVACVA